VDARAAAEAPPAALEVCRLPALENALSHYRQLDAQGGWPRVPAGPTLREGDRNERIPVLKQRLIADADLPESEGQGDIFDEKLREAVKRFQARHGIAADGLVGGRTLRELNVPSGDRLRQLAASSERCKQLPRLLDHRYIIVNIADFTLKLFADSQLRLSMPVIVGTRYRQTPVHSGRISFLELNPSWNVPPSIASKDIIPEVKKNPAYLKEQHLRVLRDWKSSEEIDPATIDWASLSPARFPYRFRQDPGPLNALGRVKFPYPNPYNLVLHDTPARGLFREDARAFSSGCIRLARPLELAAYLLQGTPLGSRESLTAAIAGEKTRRLAIPAPIAVYIVYMTAWVDRAGTIQFRPDVYGRDAAL
jgi:murein L,D-transpeptidase YcbB/YkuD